MFHVIYLVLCTCFISYLDGEEPHSLTFREIEENVGTPQFQKKLINIRGFLYQTKDGRWILAEEPNLKTCCIGAKRKLSQQIVVSGDLVPVKNHQAVTLQGLFYNDTQWDGDGNIRSVYRLEEATLLPKSSLSWLNIFVAMLAMGMGLLLMSLFFRNRRH